MPPGAVTTAEGEQFIDYQGLGMRQFLSVYKNQMINIPWEESITLQELLSIKMSLLSEQNLVPGEAWKLSITIKSSSPSRHHLKY